VASPPPRLPVAPLLAVFPSGSAAAGLLAPCLVAIAASLDTDYEGVGALVGAVYVGYALAVLAVGVLGHRVRTRSLLLAGASLQVVAVLAFAAAPTSGLAQIAAFAYGAAGTADLAATAILAGMGRERRGRVLSLAHGAYALGAVVVPLAAGAVLEAGVTWRVLFAAAAVVNAGVLAWVALSGAGGRGAGAEVEAPRAGAGLWREAEFRRGVLAMGLYIAAEVGPAIWLPAWFRDRFGASMPVAAASVAVFWASMTAGRLLLAHRVDGVGARVFVSRLAIVAACAWVAVLLSGDEAIAFAGVAFFGLAMSVCAPALQGFAAHPFPGSETPVMGWLATMSGGVGAVLPWTIGAVADHVQRAGDAAAPGDGLTLALCGGPVFLAAMAVVVRRAAVSPGDPSRPSS